MLTALLQQVGLNKYEAEAYVALLFHGSLTGYELGKRSGVPLSRSYEILEHLSMQGLALVQPGEPVRYRAEEPQQLLARLRRESVATLDALDQALADLGATPTNDGFWVARGQAAVVAHARGLIEAAQETLVLSVAPQHRDLLVTERAVAQSRGCRIVDAPLAAQESPLIALLADRRQGLLGTLEPVEHCQAVVSSHPALLAVLARVLAPQLMVTFSKSAPVHQEHEHTQPLAWLDWEQHKQRRLLQEHTSSRIA